MKMMKRRSHGELDGRMGVHSRGTRVCAWALFAVLAGTPEGALANRRNGALPAAVLAAKSIYIENQTADASLQNNAWLALAKWGQFRLADSPQKADVILRLTGSSHVSTVPSDTPPEMKLASTMGRTANNTNATNSTIGVAGYESAPNGFTRLTLVDAKSGNAVWSDLSKTNSPQAATHILDGLREAFEQSSKSRDK